MGLKASVATEHFARNWWSTKDYLEKGRLIAKHGLSVSVKVVEESIRLKVKLYTLEEGM